MKRPAQHFDMIECVWEDACDLPQGWKEGRTKAEPHYVISVGFLVNQTTKHLILAIDADIEANHNGRTQIPIGMVKKIKVLRAKDKVK